MTRAALALVLVAACYAPRYGDCEISCTPAHGCPSGLRCDDALGVCRTEGASGGCTGPGDARHDGAGDGQAPGDGPPDRDGDTIADVDDNCPDDGNVDQNDEDQDGSGDACDLCPVSTATTDSDGDGVGDACDPHPNLPGDKIVLFAGFGSWPPPGVITSARWTGSSPPGGAQIDLGVDEEARLTWAAVAAGKRTVSAKLVPSQLASGTKPGVIGPLAQFASAGSGVACAFYVQAGSQRRGLIDSVSGPIGNGVPETFGASVLANEKNGQTYTCLRDNQAPLTAGPPAQTAPSFEDGVFARGTTTSVEWVMIVTSQ